MNVRIGTLSTSQKRTFFLYLHNTLKSYPQRGRNFYMFQVLFTEYSIVALCNFYSDSGREQSTQTCSLSFQKHVCRFCLTFSAYCTAKLKLNNIWSPLVQAPPLTFSSHSCIEESSVVVFLCPQSENVTHLHNKCFLQRWITFIF